MKSPQDEELKAFVAHKSEMSERVSAFDWASTPLGTFDAWPHNLRVALGICLNSRFPMFVWWGPELIKIYNDAYIPILGQRHPDALGRPAREVWGDIWPVLEPQVEAVIQRGEATWNERVLLQTERNGFAEDTWFTWSYSPISDGAGGVAGLFCACTEETPRVLAELERDRLAEQRLLALDSAQLGWWHLDPISGQVTWDERFKTIVGAHSTSLNYEEVMRLIYPDDRERVDQATQAAMDPSDPQPYAIEARVVHADNSVHWVFSTGQVFYSGEGLNRKYTSFVGTVADITERKQSAQALLERARQAELGADVGRALTTKGEDLKEMLNRCALAMVEHLDAAFARIWTLNANEDVLELQASAGLYTHLDGPHSRIPVGQFKIGLIAKERQPHLTNQVVGDVQVSDQEWARREGMIAFAGYPLVVEDRLVGVVAVFARQPLTEATLQALASTSTSIALGVERKRGDEERAELLKSEQNARQEAESTNRIKDEFLATLSHELRTPLQAILGWAHLLRSGQLGEQDAAVALETIERNTRAQVQLVEDLLDVSRIITGKLRLEVQSLELSEIIEAAVRAVRPAAQAKNIRLQTLLDPEAGGVAGDANRLQQVVWNLLTNAVKFTPKGGQVQLRLERVDSHVEIIVSDTGQGIGSEFLPHIFDRFRQADQTSTRGQGGLGLGLSIVHHLVELHGGTIQAHSLGLGQGSTFVVQLPQMITQFPSLWVENDERRHPTAGSFANGGAASGSNSLQLNGLRVLVVDDEADSRDLLRAVLEHCSADVSVAGSVFEALEMFKSSPPDILISDIGMPDLDGYSLIEQVRAWEKQHGGRVPAVALTAYARVEDRVRALRAGFQVHIPKPVEPAELMAVVASLTGHVMNEADFPNERAS